MLKVYKAIFGREYSLKAAVLSDVATEGLEQHSTGILQVTDVLVYLEEVNKRARFILKDDSAEKCEIWLYFIIRKCLYYRKYDIFE